MPDYDVVVKSIPAQPVASLRAVRPSYLDIPRLFTDLHAYLAAHGVDRRGPNLILWHGDDPSGGVDGQVAEPVAGRLPDSGPVRMQTLPAIDQAACVVHHGGYDTIGDAYAALYRWVEEHGYQVSGPTRQVHLHYAAGADPATFVTELQFPVERA